MTRYALVLIAAAAGSLSTAAAFANDNVQVRTARVFFGDLDLNRDAGAERLYARLKAAAANTCGVADRRDPSTFADQQRCIAAALRGAVQQVNSERLTALYHANARTRTPQAG